MGTGGVGGLLGEGWERQDLEEGPFSKVSKVLTKLLKSLGDSGSWGQKRVWGHVHPAPWPCAERDGGSQGDRNRLGLVTELDLAWMMSWS